MIKVVKHTELKYCDCFLEYTIFKDDLIEYKCLLCNKNCQRKFDEKLKERFFNTYKFLITTIISLFYCCVCEYMDNWEKSRKYHYLKKTIFTVT